MSNNKKQAGMDRFLEKAKVINAYYAEVGNTSRVRSEFRQVRQTPCEWCEKFREVGCLSCLNCGAYFKEVKE